MTPRGEVLAVLAGEGVDRCPAFSGLISVTQPGLEGEGIRLSDAHTDAATMATAAATTHRISGFASAVVPLDMTIEAEVLGAVVDFGDEPAEVRFPRVDQPLAASAIEFAPGVPDSLTGCGRVPIVCEAIGILRQQFGDELAVGAWVPGPFTVATLVVDVGRLIMETHTAPDAVGDLLDRLTDMISTIAHGYLDAGADFLTVHEMGGSPGFIGPAAFESLVLPRLQLLLDSLPAPGVLSVCGHTDPAMELLAAAGADALSVDQLNDVRRSRAVVGPDVVLLGNIDPIAILSNGDEETVREAVGTAIGSGVSAVWPGCDLAPQTPRENLIAMVDAANRSKETRS